jgi:hypothetical protein
VFVSQAGLCNLSPYLHLSALTLTGEIPGAQRKWSMSVETRAQRIIQRELQRRVELHDTGRESGMYDLRIGDAAAPEVAIECVGAVDPIRTETWNIGPARGPLSLALSGDWHVAIRPDARVKGIRARIEGLLQKCEEQQLTDFLPFDSRPKRMDPSLFSEFTALGIASISCFRAGGYGQVHLGMTGIGGAVDTQGTEVPRWISQFLRAPEREDVLLKLNRSGAAECHVYVPVSFGGVPWAVESYLGRRFEALPSSAPDLPAPVTAVWLAYGFNGLRWDGTEWLPFDASDHETEH